MLQKYISTPPLCTITTYEHIHNTCTHTYTHIVCRGCVRKWGGWGGRVWWWSTVTNEEVSSYLSNYSRQRFSWQLVQWLTSWLFLVLNQQQKLCSSPAPAQSNFPAVLRALCFFFFWPQIIKGRRWHTKALSYSWLKFTGGCMVALQWWQLHALFIMSLWAFTMHTHTHQ